MANNQGCLLFVLYIKYENHFKKPFNFEWAIDLIYKR